MAIVIKLGNERITLKELGPKGDLYKDWNWVCTSKGFAKALSDMCREAVKDNAKYYSPSLGSFRAMIVRQVASEIGATVVTVTEANTIIGGPGIKF